MGRRRRRSVLPPCPRELRTIYRCLSDETRVRILHLLMLGPLRVMELEEALSLRQHLVSRHLAYLRRIGVAQARRTGHAVVYLLPEARSPELQANLDCLQKCAAEVAHLQEDLKQLARVKEEGVTRRVGRVELREDDKLEE